MQDSVISNEEVITCFGDALPLNDEGTEISTASLEYYHLSANQELFENLTKFSDDEQPIALLIGAISSGKTTLLKHFKDHSEKNCQLIQGLTKVDLQRLFLNWVDNSFFEDEQELDGETLCKIISKMPQDFILIIDDADFLSMQSLEMLMMAFGRQPSARCKLILAGECILRKRVEGLVDKNDLELQLSSFSLVPLTLIETKDFLKKTVCPAFPRGSYLLTKRSILKIHALSEGYVGRIGRIALQLASEYERSMIVSREKKGRTTLVDRLLAIGIIFLLLVVAVRIYLLYSESKTPHQIAVQATTKHVVTQPLHAINQEVVFEESGKPSFIASIENLPEERLINDLPAVYLPVPSFHSSSKKNTELAKMHQLSKYTLQLMSSPNRQTLLNYAQTLHAKNPNSAFNILKVKNGFVLTYGHFSNASAARMALSQVPTGFKNQHSVVRSFMSIK